MKKILLLNLLILGLFSCTMTNKELVQYNSERLNGIEEYLNDNSGVKVVPKGDLKNFEDANSISETIPLGSGEIN